MATGERFGSIFDGRSAVGLGEVELLQRFTTGRDEAAFAALVARHGPMVLATCRRILPERADADDAFQATFLVLARMAASISDPDRLAPWLHGVARRVAVRARAGVARRNQVEASGQGEIAVAPAPDDAHELRGVLDEELSRLPEKYRAPLVLCYLEGLTHDEAAGQLRWPVGTVRSRLAGGRDRLRSRLMRRGYASGALAVLSPQALPSAVVSRSLQALAVRLVVGTGSKSAAVALAQGVLTSMFLAKVQTIAALAVTTLTLATVGVVAAYPQARAKPNAGEKALLSVAEVPPAQGRTSLVTLKTLLDSLDLFENQSLQDARKRLSNRLTAERLRIDIAAEKRRLAREQVPIPDLSRTDLSRRNGIEQEITLLSQPNPELTNDEQYLRDIAQFRTRAEEAVQRELHLDPEAIRAGTRADGAPTPDASSKELDATNARIKALETALAALPASVGPEPTPAAAPRATGRRVAELTKAADSLQKEVDALDIKIPPELAEGVMQMKPFRAEPNLSPPPKATSGAVSTPDQADPSAVKLPTATKPPAASPAPTVQTLKGSPTLVMVTPATRDRVTMLDLQTQRRATLALGSAIKGVRASVNYSDLPGIVPTEPGEVEYQRTAAGLITLQAFGEEVRKVAVFDRRAMLWFEHDLPQPALRAWTDASEFSTLVAVHSTAVTPTNELVAFDAQDRVWLTLPLPQPIVGLILSDLSVHRTLAYQVDQMIYLYSQTAKKWSSQAIPIKLRQPNAAAPPRFNNYFQKFHDGKLVVPDESTIHIYDPQSGDWTHISIDGQ